MSTTTSPHEALVKQIAEEMAKENYRFNATGFIETQTWESQDEYGKVLSIDACIPGARIAVKHMAELRQLVHDKEQRIMQLEEMLKSHNPDNCPHDQDSWVDTREGGRVCRDCGGNI
jgi:hypothetical protein